MPNSLLRDSKRATGSYYRKDIDGLRAIAVLLVVLFHLGFSFFRAGFVGVDVFFVISGFLITRLVFKQINQKDFSLKRFYIRRIRRILPALIAVVTVTAVFAYFILLPNQLLIYFQSMFSALLSFSNIYFYKFLGVGYFSPNANQQLLLHTWSLGVEEQFYLLWPIFLLLMCRFFNKRIILLTTLFILIVSFTLYFRYKSDSVLVFYLPLTRGYELLVGAVLAMCLSKKIGIPRLGHHLLSLLSLLSLLFVACYYSSNNESGLVILATCLFSAALIYTGSYNALANRLLSTRPFVIVGMLSYSLYLWHWPLIACLYNLGVTINLSIAVFLFTLSLVLSVLTWRFVEIPFRYKFKFNFLKTFTFFPLFPVVLTSVALFVVYLYPNIGFNVVDPSAKAVVENYYGSGDKKYCMDHGIDTKMINKYCTIGAKEKKKTVLLLGDSHAMALNGMIDLLLKRKNLGGYVIAKGGTPFILCDNCNWPVSKTKHNNQLKELIKKGGFRTVVLAGYWNYYPNLGGHVPFQNFKAGLDKAVNLIIQARSQPIIFLDVPPLISLSRYCGFTRWTKHNRCAYSYRELLKIQKETRGIIYKLKVKYPKLRVVSLDSVFCPSGFCVTQINKTPLYYTDGENSHLDNAGSKIVGTVFLKKSQNIF